MAWSFADGIEWRLPLVFVAWEATEKQPIVDLRVFRHRGFTVSVLSLAFALRCASTASGR